MPNIQDQILPSKHFITSGTKRENVNPELHLLIQLWKYICDIFENIKAMQKKLFCSATTY